MKPRVQRILVTASAMVAVGCLLAIVDAAGAGNGKGKGPHSNHPEPCPACTETCDASAPANGTCYETKNGEGTPSTLACCCCTPEGSTRYFGGVR